MLGSVLGAGKGGGGILHALGGIFVHQLSL